MDVRCERCKTEYDFDDGRITEAGVTVKCTTCGHIFKVKKKALLVTVPAKAGEEGHSTAQPVTGNEKLKEWKVRQASGNIFTFRELTTLQKWIVERKVTRDDEISLTGESWKRLGNIAELASFFQVVDEATRGQQLAAMMAAAPAPGPAPAPAPLAMPPRTSGVTSSPTPPPPPRDVLGASDLAAEPAAGPSPRAESGSPTGPSSLGLPGKSSGRAEPGIAGLFGEPVTSTDANDIENQPMRALPPPGILANPAAVSAAMVRNAARPPKKQSPVALWLVLLLVLGAGGAAAYVEGYLPWRTSHPGALVLKLGGGPGAKPLEPKPLDSKPVEPKPDAVIPPAQPAVPLEDAGVLATAGSAEPDAGVAAAVTAAPAKVAVPPQANVVHDFDWYMASGDRLREREHPQAALDSYARAQELGPGRAEPVAGKGLAQLDLGNKSAAVSSFQRALELNPRYGVALMGIAEAYRSLGQKDDAAKYYAKYLELFPGSSEASVAKRALDRLRDPAKEPVQQQDAQGPATPAVPEPVKDASEK